MLTEEKELLRRFTLNEFVLGRDSYYLWLTSHLIFLTEMIMVVVMMMFVITIFQKMDYVSSSGNTAMVESIMLDLLTLSQKDMKQI